MQIDEIPSERRPLADLHVHTTASDGTLTPVETVHAAASAGLMAVGISDHDTVAGVKDALEAGAEADVLVVPAIEINTDFGESEVHMLGYFIDIESATMLAHLVELREHRLERARLMVEKLNEIGVMVPFERVLEIAGTGSVGRPHIARAIVEAGGASGMNGAFGKFLVKGAPAYVPRFKLTPFQALDIIRSAGGVASMAHPGSSKHDELIPQLVAAGMQALECYHTDHNSHARKHYLKLAKKYDLIPTGGSDSHGPHLLRMVPIGHVTVDIDVVYSLRELASGR